MKSTLKRALGFIVAVAIAFAWVGAPMAAVPRVVKKSNAAATCTAAGRPLVDMSQQVVTELAGLQAAKILQQAAIGNPQKAAAMEASRKAMTAKGWKHVGPSGFMIRAKSSPEKKSVVARAWDFFFPRLNAQTYGTADPINGIVIYDSWTDGDDSTWEGSSYYENYDSNQWMFYDDQLLTDVDTEPQLLSLSPRGSSDQRDFHRTREGNLEPIRFGQALSDPTVCNCPLQGGGPGQPRKPAGSDMECFTRVGMNRAAATCGASFGLCRRAAGGYWACVGTACAAAAAAQTLAEFYRWMRDCWPQ